MGFSFSMVRTKGGYKLAECASALQKSIRRSEEDEALFWATEMFLSGYDEYAWKRMRVICSEDVGVGEPNIAANIYALWQLSVDQKKNNSPGKSTHRLHFIHAVLILCRAKKSRLCDHIAIALLDGEREQRAMPDYALDVHTNAGKQLGRGQDHFFDEGGKLINPDGNVLEDDRYKERARVARKLQKEKGKSAPNEPDEPDETDDAEAEFEQSNKATKGKGKKGGGLLSALF